MTAEEIKRFEQYQKLDEKRERFKAFLNNIRETENLRLQRIDMVIQERGIIRTDDAFALPEEIQREMYDYILTRTEKEIEDINQQINNL